MKNTSVNLTREIIKDIDKLCTGDHALFSNRSEFIRHSVLMFCRDFIIHEDRKRELKLTDKNKVLIQDEFGVLKTYKIVRGLD